MLESIQNYNDIVNILTSVGKFRISLGLDRISKILELLGNPQEKLNCIQVAGTNGKGSVCAILSSILAASGKTVGLYTSPHLFKYNERIKICGKDITDNDFIYYLKKILLLSKKNNIDLTEFELLTAIMFQYFYDKNVDIVVLETGLGGRFDATNVISHNICSVITHVDYDHMDRLGNTISEIAYEKAGIIKSNCPCIVYEGLEVYYDVALEKNSLLTVILPFADTTNLALKGDYQQENLALALAVIEKFFPEIEKNIIDNGLKNVSHPCRFQYIKDKNLIIDGAHNPNGIQVLRQSLESLYPDCKYRFIFGCLDTKDYKSMMNILFRENDEIYFYHYSHKNSCTYETLKNACEFESKNLIGNESQINFNDGKLNIVCGSFYMISDIVSKFDINLGL